MKGFFNPSHSPHCDLNAILVTAVTEWLKALLLCHPCPLSVFLSFSLMPERSAIRNMPRDTIGKSTGPYGAIVTSVNVSTSSCIRQNEPLRTTITSSTNKCLLLQKKKKKDLMKRHLWMRGRVINESHACPSGFSLLYLICFQTGREQNDSFLLMLGQFGRDHLKVYKNAINGDASSRCDNDGINGNRSTLHSHWP